METPGSIIVEQPKVEDAEAIRDLVYRTWLATYINDEQGVTREHIDADFSESRTDEGMHRRRETLATPPKRVDALVCTGRRRHHSWDHKC